MLDDDPRQMAKRTNNINHDDSKSVLYRHSSVKLGKKNVGKGHDNIFPSWRNIPTPPIPPAIMLPLYSPY